jgi:hypothetical protein
LFSKASKRKNFFEEKEMITGLRINAVRPSYYLQIVSSPSDDIIGTKIPANLL